MKHGYGNLGAVPVLGTIEVWVQSGYRCMCTPGIPHFFQKKKISGTGRVRVGYRLGTGEAESSQERRRFPEKIFDSQSLSLPSSLCRHSHILSLPTTMHSELRFGLAATENQFDAPFLGFLFFLLGIFLSLRWA